MASGKIARTIAPCSYGAAQIVCQENYTGRASYTVTESGYYEITNQVNVANSSNHNLTITVNGCGVSTHRTAGIRYERATIFLYISAGDEIAGSYEDTSVQCQLQIRKIP